MSEAWSREELEILRREWAEGTKVRRIAAELKHRRSRNAIIGRARRLGLPPHKQAPGFNNQTKAFNAAAARKGCDKRWRNNPSRPPWTEVHVARLRLLWLAGAAVTRIAEDLGVSKCAVISKAHRLDLPRRLAKPRPPFKRKHWKTEAVEQRTLKEQLILSLPPSDPPRRVYDVGGGECRFICGDPKNDWAYCAREAAHGPYCRHHAWLVAHPSLRHRYEGEQAAAR